MNIRKNSGWLIHIAIWAVILAMPFFSPQPGRALHGGLDYSRFLTVTISFVIVFYTNYLFLIKHFLSNKRFGAFLFWNMLLITKVSIGVYLFFRYLISPDIAPPHHSTLDTISFTFRNTVIYMAIVGIAVAVKMTTEWYNNEAQRKEIEKNQAEAELANLKNQVNPHFLFNTLNVILQTAGQEKAYRTQALITALSHLLRYSLMSNDEQVPLAREVRIVDEYYSIYHVRFGDRLFDVVVFNIDKKQIVGGIIQDVTKMEMKKERIAEKAKDVIRKNLATVQQIACTLGEHMAETEILLRSIAEDYAGGESESSVEKPIKSYEDDK